MRHLYWGLTSAPPRLEPSEVGTMTSTACPAGGLTATMRRVDAETTEVTVSVRTALRVDRRSNVNPLHNNEQRITVGGGDQISETGPNPAFEAPLSGSRTMISGLRCHRSSESATSANRYSSRAPFLTRRLRGLRSRERTLKVNRGLVQTNRANFGSFIRLAARVQLTPSPSDR